MWNKIKDFFTKDKQTDKLVEDFEDIKSDLQNLLDEKDEEVNRLTNELRITTKQLDNLKEKFITIEKSDGKLCYKIVYISLFGYTQIQLLKYIDTEFIIIRNYDYNEENLQLIKSKGIKSLIEVELEIMTNEKDN